MCLGIPGRVTEVDQENGLPMGTVDLVMMSVGPVIDCAIEFATSFT